MDGGSARDGPQEGRKSAGTVKRKKRRKQKVIPGFVPYRKLVAKALETAGSKGLTKAALSEALLAFGEKIRNITRKMIIAMNGIFQHKSINSFLVMM